MVVQPNSSSRLHLELLISGHWRDTMCYTTHVVGQKVVIPDYRCWKGDFICSTRGRNLHEDTRKNERSTCRKLHIWRYVDTYKIYLCYCISSTLLVQGMHQVYEPQGVIQTMQEWPLSFIPSKWNQNCNIHCIYIWHAGNWGKSSLMNTIECIKK